MENDPFKDDFPSYKPPFIVDFPASYVSHNQRVALVVLKMLDVASQHRGRIAATPPSPKRLAPGPECSHSLDHGPRDTLKTSVFIVQIPSYDRRTKHEINVEQDHDKHQYF